MAASDVFALGSRQEGLPVAVMEALAAGLPVVAPNVGGLPLAVDDGVSGRLVRPEDPLALADALASVLGDTAERSLLAAGARRSATRFDVRRAVATIEARYDDLSRKVMAAR